MPEVAVVLHKAVVPVELVDSVAVAQDLQHQDQMTEQTAQ
jgi:hypothetical protein